MFERLVPVGIVAGCLVTGLVACVEGAEPGGKVAVGIAALELPGVSNACFTLSVHNGAPGAGGQLVWTRPGVCADDFGDGTGSIAYVGTCDANVPNDNVVSLVLEDLYTGTPPAALGGVGYVNPCPANQPCKRSVPCLENADAAVTFNLTVMRDADQGFFDIAVNFADVFCSAKFDCLDSEGDTLELLHDPATGDRAPTGVLGFACTSGQGETTWLHMDDIVITCQGGTTTVDPSPGVCSDDPTFSDDTFAPAWSSGFIAGGNVPSGNFGTFSTAQVTGGGNTTPTDPDPYLEADITNRGDGRVHTYALMPGATWNPSTQGPITGIRARYDIRLRSITGAQIPSTDFNPVQPSQGGNAQFAIEQGGIIYAPSLGSVCPAETNCDTWRTRSGNWVVPAQIGALSNAIGSPGAPPLNLTNGGPVRFGVLIGLTGGNPNYVFHYDYEVDNFAVELDVDCVEALPGNAGAVLPGTFQTAVYWGRENFSGLDKCYWNTALGWNLGAEGLGKNCVLTTRGTASPTEFIGGATPANTTWPVISWTIPITDNDGALVCGAHPLNGPGSGVTTGYTEGTAETFDQSRACPPAPATP
ncbi:MAG: hypothetical protein JNJ59_27975 [Deltaproteobacteria bacterium]|nr:hypothetical protein [Deltaproteobacteria bacterium]